MDINNNRDFKKILFLIVFAVCVYAMVTNLAATLSVIGKIFSVVAPFIIGGAFAFILNGPFEFFKNRVFRFSLSTPEKTRKVKNAFSLIVTYVLVLAFIVVLISFLVPQLVASISKIANYIPKDSSGIMKTVTDFFNKYFKNAKLTDTIMSMSGTLGTAFKNFLTSAVPSVASSVSSLASNVINVVIAVVVSIYILVDKKHLYYQYRLLVRAYLKEETAERVLYLTQLTADTFSGFITGQIMDAIVLGFLCGIILTVCGFPYAILIGTIIGFTNIIPYFGPFIGTVPSFIILALEKPVYGLIFLGIVLALQQLDSKVLYPNIVGHSVGLGALFVTFAIIAGGGLFGLLGMIIGVPVFAVIYTLLRENAYRRVKEKNITEI